MVRIVGRMGSAVNVDVNKYYAPRDTPFVNQSPTPLSLCFNIATIRKATSPKLLYPASRRSSDTRRFQINTHVFPSV